MATDLNSFGNHVSGQISALVEFGNMVANLRNAKQATAPKIRNEYFKQAAYSALLGIGNLASVAWVKRGRVGDCTHVFSIKLGAINQCAI